MDALHKIEHWADTHHPLWLDFLRIALGIYIFIKGLIFLADTDALASMLPEGQHFFSTMFLVHYIGFVHLIGGIFIAVGLITRVAVILQIPILLGAVFMVNVQDFSRLEFWISLIVLILLFVFLFYGSGKFSVTGYAKDHPDEN